MNKYLLSFLLPLFVLKLNAQVIDVHLHSYTNTDYWGGRTHPTGIDSPKSADEHLQQTISLLDKHQTSLIQAVINAGAKHYNQRLL